MSSYPCKMLKGLDRRYRTKYHMSMIDNLNFIKEKGIELFLEKEKEKWECKTCGDVICCHNGLCLNHQIDEFLNNKKYRWDKEESGD